jgi:hypothetical protein
VVYGRNFPQSTNGAIVLDAIINFKSHVPKPGHCSRDGPTVSNTDVGYAIIINCVWTLCCSSQRFAMQIACNKFWKYNDGRSLLKK